MWELYFSLSSHWLFLALEKDNRCLVSLQKENARQHSENFLVHLGEILAQHHCSLPEIKKIYFTSSPGGQTGLRVSLAFLATLRVLNPQIKIYQINTLLFQAGEKNCLSLLTIDSQASKYHLAVYQKKKCLLTSQIVRVEEKKKITAQFPNFTTLKDFEGVDFLTNFQQLKGDFVLWSESQEIPRNCL